MEILERPLNKRKQGNDDQSPYQRSSPFDNNRGDPLYERRRLIINDELGRLDPEQRRRRREEYYNRGGRSYDRRRPQNAQYQLNRLEPPDGRRGNNYLSRGGGQGGGRGGGFVDETEVMSAFRDTYYGYDQSLFPDIIDVKPLMSSRDELVLPKDELYSASDIRSLIIIPFGKSF